MTIQLALIGEKIGQSRMPKLQMYLAKLSGVDLHYEIIDVDGQSDFVLADALQRLKQLGFHGANITQPFKQQAWHLVHASQPSDNQLGAYNTLTFDHTNGGLLGTSTDRSGFVSAFRRRLEGHSPGRVLLAGAGGVGRSVAFGLAELGVDLLCIYDTNRSQAEDLAAALPHVSSLVVRSEEEFISLAPHMDGLVNCTPKGMYYLPESSFPASVIGQQQWAFDAVYTPLQTEFVKHGQRAGLEIISGFDLWIHQGLDAFEIFTGTRVEANDALLEETLSWL